MRTPISERNLFPYFSPRREYIKIRKLFCDEKPFCLKGLYSNNYYSYLDILKRNFLLWDLRGSFTTVEEMLCSLQIHEDVFSRPFSNDKLLDYIEFILNALGFVNASMASPVLTGNNNTIGNTIRTQCYLVLDRLDAEVKRNGSELFVVYKNDIAAAVSIQQPELAHSVVEYLKIDNRDDLEHKAEILCSLYKQLEPSRKRLKDNVFDNLCSHTAFLLNEAGIRHAFIPGKSKPVFLTMNRQDLIKWYDRAFEMFLACMAVLPYSGYKKELENLTKNKQN